MEFDPKNELAKLLIANDSPLAKLLIGWPPPAPPPPPRNWLAEVMADQYFGGPFGTQPPYGSFDGPFGLLQKQTKRKVFVSYHHGGDQADYDAFTTAFHDTYEAVYDNSLDRQIDSDDVDYVRRRTFENHIKGSSCTLVLVGRNTWGRKYVDWEIDATLDKQHGLIGVVLPTAPISLNNTVPAPGRLYDNVQSGYAVWVTWAQLTQSTAALKGFIETACLRSANLINNKRDRRYRNEPLQ